MTFEFSGPLVHWVGPAPWYFVEVPAGPAQDLKTAARLVTYGWGMIPVRVQLGAHGWNTSLFPKDGAYLVPIKAVVRTAAGLQEGDTVTVRLGLR